MKLSEAINLGAVTVKMEAFDLSSCAIGAACNAVGALEHGSEVGDKYFNRYHFARESWPWLNNWGFINSAGQKSSAINAIYTRFDRDVVSGLMTLEELIDYVASIEPSCGECNKFDCTCTPALAEAKVEVLACSRP